MALAAQHVRPDLLAKESALLLKKWPAYRFMTPWAATQLYVSAYRDHFRFNFCISVEFEVTPGTPEFQVLWEMRQAADRQFMPYGALLSIAFSMNRRNANPYLKPHKRFSNLEKNRLFTRKLWKAGSHPTSTLWYYEMGPQFWVDAYADLPGQNDFRDRLVDLSRRHGRWNDLACDMAVRRRYLSDDALQYDMDSRRQAEWAKALAEERANPRYQPEPYPGIQPHDLWQSCFGVPGAANLKRNPCGSCPAATECIKAGEIVGRAATAAT